MEEIKIESVAFGQSEQTDKSGNTWVFWDSKFLPIETTYKGETQLSAKSGGLIPAGVFATEFQYYFISVWSRPTMPLEIKPGDKVKIYADEKLKKVVLLKLN